MSVIISSPDRTLLVIVAFLVILGLMSIFSASAPKCMEMGTNPAGFVFNQLIFLVAGFIGIVKGRQLLKVRRAYWDIKSKKQRGIGEVFAADKERAKELLSNENNIVEEL
jgi:hypothetical protein